MNNPLLELNSLPAFDRIEARHARPALEKVLADNRARLAELTAQPHPTFASLVIPVEELSYREIGKKLNVHEWTVRRRILAVLETIQSVLEGE